MPRAESVHAQRSKCANNDCDNAMLNERLKTVTRPLCVHCFRAFDGATDSASKHLGLPIMSENCERLLPL